MCYEAVILAVLAVRRSERVVEHPLLHTRPMRRSHVAPALLAVATALALPSTAFALSPTIGAFGTGSHNGVNTDLVTYPIPASECGTAIPLTFSSLMTTTTTRYIDVWYGTSASAGCQTGTVRASTTSPVCHYVTSIPYTTGPNLTVSTLTASILFGGCASDERRTFFFFDTTTTEENTMTYTSFWTLDVAVDVTAPSAPTITSTPAGDTLLSVDWNSSASTDLGIAGKVNVYVDTAGCSGDGGTSTLMQNAAPPSTYTQQASASSPVSVTTSTFGWTAGTYGQSVAIAIATVDTAGNVSNLSNVVCATHVAVSGFWDEYCASHGMTDPTACANNYRGCSVGLPTRRWDLSACGVGLLVAGLFVSRRRRRAR